MKKILICSAIALMCNLSYAIGLTQEGVPNDTSLTRAYGINVATRAGLKTLIPSDFKLYIHKDIQLPEFISWNIGKPWTDELSKIAFSNNLNVLIKWDQKSVFITTEKLIEENKETTIIAHQAATTPLPKFSSKTSSKQAIEPKEDTLPAKLETPSKVENSVVRSAAEVQIEKIKAEKIASKEEVTADAVVQPILQASTPNYDDFRYNAPIAFSRISLRQVSQSIANTFSYRLIFNIPDVKMPGPVTLFGKEGSVEQDVELLNSALGLYHYAQVQISGNNLVVSLKSNRVVPSKDLIPVKMELPYEDTPARTQVVNSSVEAPKQSAAVSKSVEILIEKGSTLESALYNVAKNKGYSLNWKVAGGFEATKSLKYVNDSLEGLLSDVLPKVGLTYEIKNNVITVVPGASAL